mmetsp:Transcript_37212/g.57924  ORF Transcript_37212/g.57924 Transcript_37212/m.57924 type:complete len:244 (+) Transcript_37212:2053-2784(+)
MRTPVFPLYSALQKAKTKSPLLQSLYNLLVDLFICRQVKASWNRSRCWTQTMMACFRLRRQFLFSPKSRNKQPRQTRGSARRWRRPSRPWPRHGPSCSGCWCSSLSSASGRARPWRRWPTHSWARPLATQPSSWTRCDPCWTACCRKWRPPSLSPRSRSCPYSTALSSRLMAWFAPLRVAGVLSHFATSWTKMGMAWYAPLICGRCWNYWPRPGRGAWWPVLLPSSRSLMPMTMASCQRRSLS